MSKVYERFIVSDKSIFKTRDGFTFNVNGDRVFSLTLFESDSEANRVDKSEYLHNPLVLEGTLRESSSFFNPTVTVQLFDVPRYNYCYIPIWDRYYFIEDVSVVNHDLYTLSLRCDALMSFCDKIRELECFVARQENDYNVNLNDENLPASIDPVIDVYEYITTYFNEYGTFILTTMNDGETPSIDPRPPLASFSTMYKVNQPTLNYVADSLLTTDWGAAVSKMFNNPMESIVSLKWFPMSLDTDTTAPIRVGSSDLKREDANSNSISIVTGVFENVRYKTRVASIPIQRKYNNFLDFAPYTKVELYLAKIGFITLDTNLVMGKTVTVDYSVDLFEGVLTAFIKVENQLLDTKQIRISTDISLSGNNAGDIARNLIGVGAGAVAGIASIIATQGATASIVGTIASTSVGTINALQQHYTKSGANGGASMLDFPNNFTAVVTRPNVETPANYAHFYGRPLYETRTLSDLTGFTQIETCHLDGFDTATRQELNEIDGLLKQGFIL